MRLALPWKRSSASSASHTLTRMSGGRACRLTWRSELSCRSELPQRAELWPASGGGVPSSPSAVMQSNSIATRKF